VNVKTVEKDITICANISNLWPFLMKKTVCLPSTAFIVQACATNCLRNVDTMEGGLMEPLSVALHATELSNAKIGETAIV